MVIYIGEKEMIERYGDSLKEAASRCRELPQSIESDRPDIFIKLVSSLKVAAGSAHQLSMAQINPKFLFLRDTLEKFSEFAQATIFQDSESGIWLLVATKLEELADSGMRMASAKSLSRQDVLDELGIRKQALEN